MRGVLVIALLLSLPTGAAAQSGDRDRARPHVLAGWKHMSSEAYPQAAAEFSQAIEIDRNFEDAYYGLGLANVRMKKFGEAIPLYIKCRDLYRAQADRQFANRQDAQRYRADRLKEIDEVIRSYQSTSPTGQQSQQTQARILQLQAQRREIEEALRRGNDLSVENWVPSYVYLALGSAYFRTGQMADAEREYNAAIQADPKAGEAFNNLAVVYLQSGRFKEADAAVKSAERAGFKVHPQLKEDIKAKLKS
jgi:tetratricopeptide (TPR) repeat protein